MKIRVRKRFQWRSLKKKWAVEIHTGGPPIIASWVLQRWLSEDEDPSEVQDGLAIGLMQPYMGAEWFAERMLEHERKYGGDTKMWEEQMEFHRRHGV